MPRATERCQSVLQFDCDICNKSYSKKEHLQRHERTHTGLRPFACRLCGRSFARQDALNRHARVHTHNSISEGTNSPSGMDLISPMSQGPMAPPAHHQTVSDPYSTQQSPGMMQPLGSDDSFQTELQASSLFWPDSEHLLQNIMSTDPALWEQPIGLIPPVLESNMSPIPLSHSFNVEEDASGTNVGEGHRAIHTLSALINHTVNGVTSHAVLANLTSRFLDSCLHMFFSTFIPMLPVIHRSTFVFRDCSPPLLLNAIAIGSLFLGTPEATAKGDALWRLAHTAVATSWHSMINQKSGHDSSPGLQLVLTTLLSQVYAALARSRTLRMTSQVFHGLGIYWARYCGLFELPELQPFPSFDEPHEIKYLAWRAWLSREAQLRTLLGLYILDGVISQFSGNPTFAQHMSNLLPIPSDEKTFNATNPDEWLQCLMEKTYRPRPRFCDMFRKFFYPHDDKTADVPNDISLFSLKVVLEGLKSLVAESKRIEPTPVGVPPQSEINLVLDRLYTYILASPRLTQVERSTAMLRWHAICLDALVNTARGARRLCYPLGIKQHIFGGNERLEKNIDPANHVKQDSARRTLLHAAEIQRIASQLPLGLAHDPHVPGAVFAAATTYAAFALAGKNKIVFPKVVDWGIAVLLPKGEGEWGGGDIDEVGRDSMRFIRGILEESEDGRGTVVRDLSYELSSMRLLLRGLSLQWGVSMEMEEVVEAWISKCG